MPFKLVESQWTVITLSTSNQVVLQVLYTEFKPAYQILVVLSHQLRQAQSCC